MRAFLSVPPRCSASSPHSKTPSLVLTPTSSCKTPHDLALDLEVALGDVFQVRPQMAMRLGQIVEGDVGKEVMLGVVGQVPHQEAHDRIAECGAGVGEAVVAVGAERVLAHQV